MVETKSSSSPSASQAPESEPGAARQEPSHHERLEERLERTEHRADMFVLVLIFLLGAAMAIGLVTATGHVTW